MACRRPILSGKGLFFQKADAWCGPFQLRSAYGFRAVASKGENHQWPMPGIPGAMRARPVGQKARSFPTKPPGFSLMTRRAHVVMVCGQEPKVAVIAAAGIS